MASQNCSNCSAALPLAHDEPVVRCPYCGTDNRVRGGGLKIRIGGGDPHRSRVAVIFVAMGLLALGVAGAVLMLLMPVPEPDPPIPSPVAEQIRDQVAESLKHLPKPAPEGGVAPSQLGTIAGQGWVTVQAPPVPFAGFDPVEHLPWAMEMAKAWSTDARIGSIYIDGVRRDGALDVSARDDFDVDYRFFSPTLRTSAREMAKVSEEVVHSELRIMISEGTVEALLGERHGRDRPDPPVYEPQCAFPDVMKRAVGSGLGERPFYDLMLTWVSGRWRWHVGGKDIKSAVVYEPCR